MTPHEETSRKLVAEWLHKANADLAAAECLLSESDAFAGIVMFHCQQAAEKFLKAFLTWRGTDFPKTHDLGTLLNLIETVDRPLAVSLLTSVALTSYGVELRYPSDHREATAEEARDAVELAKKVRDAVLPLLPAPPNGD
jgi:HEPN domain-containing protein